MAKKRGQDEVVFLFALKTVGGLFLILIWMAYTDVSHVVHWLRDTSPSGNSVLSEIRYQWYMLF